MNIKLLKKEIITLGFLLFFLSHCSFSKTDKSHKANRENMVKQQIERRGVKDPEVLKALLKVQRHIFVPRQYRPYAYTDQPLPIGHEQTISQPYIVALMTELLDLQGGEKILEIGTGSGYQAAVLAELADSVFTIEIIEPLAKRSESLLDSLGYSNIEVKYGDGYIGWEEHAPFDGIIVTAAPPEVPQPLIDQLAEGGRMVIPVGKEYQQLQLLRKTDGKISTEIIIPVRFVPMTGKALEE